MAKCFFISLRVADPAEFGSLGMRTIRFEMWMENNWSRGVKFRKDLCGFHILSKFVKLKFCFENCTLLYTQCTM